MAENLIKSGCNSLALQFIIHFELLFESINKISKAQSDM